MIPMKNLMKKIKMNNKGFTLVELIVVIAVLAIITVVAAPQYIKYVEKSRVAVDENAVKEIAHIAEVAAVELAAEGKIKIADKTTVTVTCGADKASFSPNTDGTLGKYIEGMIGDYKFVSETYKGKNVQIDVQNGVATVGAPK